jgi:uncharacterized protein (TIGR03118 family)
MVKRLLALVASLVLLALGALPAAAHDTHAANRYTVHTLVSDATDADLINGWGISASPTSPWWVADNGTDKSTLYTGAGVKIGLTVDVPGGPTGTVFNGTGDFLLSSASNSQARFLFATEDGTIRGWNPNVPAAGSTATEVGATTPGAIYKGLAIGSVGTANYLYAADFHDGRVDVFDGSFTRLTWTGKFVDPRMPRHYAPFGIQNLKGMIFVTYARQDAIAKDEIDGAGRGFVSAFATDGTFLGRVASRDELNSPWGLAWAPAGFGKFSGDLLVGNFGDGRITAFRWTGHHWVERGQLRRANHRAISIDGLWGIGFGNGAGSGPTTTLYFAAGPGGEKHGRFGSITAP